MLCVFLNARATRATRRGARLELDQNWARYDCRRNASAGESIASSWESGTISQRAR